MSVPIQYIVLSNTTITLNVKLGAASASSSLVCGKIFRGKGKFVPVHIMKAYGGSGSIAPPILKLGTSWM